MANDIKELEYTRARNLFDKKDEKSIREAKEIFLKLEDYKESNRYLNECILMINKFDIENTEKQKEDYARACMLMTDKKSAYKLDQAIKLFKELGDYEDSKNRLNICNELRINITKKDKKGLKGISAMAYFFVGLSILLLAIIIIAFIWQSFFAK